MYQVFEVTDWGLKLDGKDIAPGSKLLHKPGIPAAWKSVGKVVGQATDGDIKRAQQFEVATPAVKDDDNQGTESDDLAEEYERVLGKKPHPRMKEETMRKAIEDAQ